MATPEGDGALPEPQQLGGGAAAVGVSNFSSSTRKILSIELCGKHSWFLSPE